MYDLALESKWSKNCLVNCNCGALSGSLEELVITLSIQEVSMSKEGEPLRGMRDSPMDRHVVFGSEVRLPFVL